MKKILVIDDSALMRRVVSDIISTTEDYRVEYTASDGIEGLAIIEEHKDDITAVLCDICMPNMNGLELLKTVKQKRLDIPFIIFSSTGNVKDTILALEYGAVEFVKKPGRVGTKGKDKFALRLKSALKLAAQVKESGKQISKAEYADVSNDIIKKVNDKKKRLIALCCSTGGPNALQHVIPRLPKKLAAPITVVQHMPEGFTHSLAARLNEMSEIEVRETVDNEEIKTGVCYIAKGGSHLKIERRDGTNYVRHSDDYPILGLRPYANIMYSSLIDTDYDEIVCVVMTGMGSDGTNGILELAKKKKVYVIAQDEKSSTVYGMPRAIYESKIVDKVCPLESIAEEITKKVGVL